MLCSHSDSDFFGRVLGAQVINYEGAFSQYVPCGGFSGSLFRLGFRVQ